ncbi:MAG: mechanosensitive ion channel domain-containing protein [Chloroflexota bacterium]
MNILDTLYYGNTLIAWAAAFGLILGSFVVGRILYWFLGRYVKKLTAHTQTELDDLLLDNLEEPLVALIIIFGTRYALATLTLPETFITGIANLSMMALALVVTWAVLRLYEALHVTYIVDLVSRSETDLDDQLLPIMRNGFRFVVVALGIIVGLNNAGYDVGAVLAGLGIGGLAFALAAQDTVANFFGGVMLFVQRPFQINDRILVNGIEGYIREIGLRSSLIETITGEPILIPNKMFTESAIYTRDLANTYFETTTLHLARNTSLKKIEALVPEIRAISQRHEEIEWVSPVFNGITGTHYELFVKMGVARWERLNEPQFADHYDKLNLARTNLHLNLARLLKQHQVRLAVPFEVRYHGRQVAPRATNGVYQTSALPNLHTH